jgi:DNA polymerase-3 subunit epsilon
MQINLTDLQILALDCQTTGANPEKGYLLEIGWVQTRAAETVRPQDLPVKSYPVSLPPDVEIPKAVQRVTGISKETLGDTLPFPSADIWQKIVKTAGRIAAADHMHRCPTIIHYARFEAPFLRNLQAESKRRGKFPLRLICTHEIAKRLLPGLPRKGLRAVAGYYGHTVPPSRRSADHAVATAVIWQNLILQLKADHGIQNLNQLTDWLDRTTPQNRTDRVYPMKREIRLNLPEKPGIYRMLRSNGDLLYIGKATSLKHRVNSYFRQKGPRAEHTLEMLSQAADLDVTLTGSALEAALLESDEIKRHSPPYNVALRKGQRKLMFCSRDLRNRAKPDKIHVIGPLPEGNITAAMTAFGDWHNAIRHSTEDEFLKIGYDILGVPQSYAPEPDCIAEGLALFHRNQLTRLAHPSPLRIITGLGRELWQERLEAIENVESETGEDAVDAAPVDQESELEEAPGWSPEMVARGIEKFIMRSALLIRRARWLCLLSESSLAWQTQDSGGRRKIVLRFENGIVAHREELPGEAEVPLPAGYAKRIANRQKIFDLTTYERLRVVTTELRRLVAAGRNVEICLRPNTTLSRRQLARMLPWV